MYLIRNRSVFEVVRKERAFFTKYWLRLLFFLTSCLWIPKTQHSECMPRRKQLHNKWQRIQIDVQDCQILSQHPGVFGHFQDSHKLLRPYWSRQTHSIHYDERVEILDQRKWQKWQKEKMKALIEELIRNHQLFQLAEKEQKKRVTWSKPTSRGEKDLKSINKDLQALINSFIENHLFVKIHMVYKKLLQPDQYPTASYQVRTKSLDIKKGRVWPLRKLGSCKVLLHPRY